jgi:hypothetical protein
MRGHLDAARVRIEVPDADSAFRLERRLAGRHPVSIGRGPRWEVDIEDHGDATDAIADAVRDWLADMQLSRTRMWVDGDQLDVEQRA